MLGHMHGVLNKIYLQKNLHMHGVLNKIYLQKNFIDGL